MGPQPERRRHRRFDMVSSGTRLARVRTSSARMDLESFELLNLSQGGMCVRGPHAIHRGAVEYFLMDLTEPFPSVILVRAEGRWAKSGGLAGQVMGLNILESSNGWFGENDSEHQGHWARPA